MKTCKLDSGYIIEVLGAGLGRDTALEKTEYPWYLYNPLNLDEGHWMSQDEMDALVSKIQEVIK